MRKDYQKNNFKLNHESLALHVKVTMKNKEFSVIINFVLHIFRISVYIENILYKPRDNSKLVKFHI